MTKHWLSRLNLLFKLLGGKLLARSRTCRALNFITERLNKMDDGSKQEKSTGSIPPIKTAKGNVSAPVDSTGPSVASPVLKDAPIKDEFSNSTKEVSASELLALQILMGDFKEVKAKFPVSWQASSNGKIYWCAEMPGHRLDIADGNLLVDGVAAETIFENLMSRPDAEPSR
jgi:hypothetical protein